ncbi:hypothetical protein VTO42DRAFT_1829 [Malbranchea cinnamomea]
MPHSPLPWPCPRAAQTFSTKGSADNADGKLRPDRIQEWIQYADEQTAIWHQLVNEENKDFIVQRNLISFNALMGSIVKALYQDERLRQVFELQGHIDFENHTNTLTDDEDGGRGGGTCWSPRQSSGRELAGQQRLAPLQPLADLWQMSFAYTAGVEYGYVSPGEAFIVLHYNPDDPGTVYYYLSVPAQDVGETTGFTGELEGSNNRLQMIAVGQVLAFALRAIQTAPLGQSWRNWAKKQLKATEKCPDDYQEQPYPHPIAKRAIDLQSNVRRSAKQPRRSDITVGAPPSPAGASSHKGPVSKDWNSAILHAEVFAWSRECYPFQHGYTFVKKGFPMGFRHFFRHEKALYDRLQPIQGVHVHVCLGTIDISKQPTCYDGIAYIPHLLLLAHAGVEISDCYVAKEQVISAASKSLRAIHALGVLHRDVDLRNMFWTGQSENVLVIDVKRAEILRPGRAPLRDTSPNQKRKRRNENPGEETKKKQTR